MTSLVYSVNEIKEMVVPILKQHNVKKAVLFGSYANRSASENSDVDIFIDSGGALSGLNFFTLYNHIEECLNKKLDLIEALDVEKESRIYNEIVEHGLVLYEG